MKKNAKRIITRAVLALVIGVVFGLSFYSCNARVVSRDPMPMPFGIGVSAVLSGSMEPELSVGDLIVVIREDRYVVGDVIVFQSGQSAVVHRIISIDGENVITKGDANNSPDDPINVNAIKGKVKTSLSGVGYVVSMIKSPVGTILILGLAVLLWVRSLGKEKQEENDQLARIREEIEKLKEQQEKQ